MNRSGPRTVPYGDHPGHGPDARTLRRWTDSGARDLTGHPNKPGVDPPSGLIEELDRIASSLATDTSRRVQVDPLEIITERARCSGLSRRGQISCGAGTRMLRTSDSWLAICLARPGDVELLAAWLEVDPAAVPRRHPLDETDWDRIATLVSERLSNELEKQGAVLGLAVGVLPTGPVTEHPSLSPSLFNGLPVDVTSCGEATPQSLETARVVDLSSLWAGPLCARLLAEAGAEVIKVESVTRPDGARRGDQAFFELLNSAKSHQEVDLTRRDGVDELRRLIAGADVVIEASRPRALRQLGIDAQSMLADGPRVWVSITGHGRTGPGAHRIAFGDDAAVSGGLVAYDSEGDPVFCADAIADPISGLVAAAAVARALTNGGRWLLDVSMRRVAAHLGAQGCR